MNFEDLQELLRQELERRIAAGDLTGTEIARRAGFRQAHISNFLNRKRALSLPGLDKVLESQGMTVDGLLPLELSAGAAVPEPLEGVPLVSASAAAEDAQVRPTAVLDTVPVAVSRLECCRRDASPKYEQWQRFVAVRADGAQAAAMDPMIADGAVVVVDRHYNSVTPYRAQQKTLFAVRSGSGLALRFVDFDEGRLILRPLKLEFPVQLVTMAPGEGPADYIVGRVCMVMNEL